MRLLTALYSGHQGPPAELRESRAPAGAGFAAAAASLVDDVQKLQPVHGEILQERCRCFQINSRPFFLFL